MYYANRLNTPSHVQFDEETIPVFARWFGSWRVSLQRRALSAPQLTRSYDRAAPGWSQMLDRLGFPDAYETLLRGVLSEEAPAMTGAQLRVLDCGVGTGALSCALARVAPAPFKLDAIDISPRMLVRARRRLRDTGLEVSLRHGDVRHLPYDTGVFDLAMAGHVLEHLGDPSLALAEMVRVLKPGGLLVVCLTRRSPLGVYVHLKWRTHRVTPAEAESWLLESGLEHARCHSFDHRTLCRGLSLACVGRKPHRESQNGGRARSPVR
ncbi:MAG: class I SAM-dependent methyltransferase [Methyloligellaceae bacterium]